MSSKGSHLNLNDSECQHIVDDEYTIDEGGLSKLTLRNNIDKIVSSRLPFSLFKGKATA